MNPQDHYNKAQEILNSWEGQAEDYGTFRMVALPEEDMQALRDALDALKVSTHGGIMTGNINNNDLPRLKTQELIDIYHQRHDDADAVWGQIMMRTIRYEQVMEENSRLLLLLRDCAKLIETSEDAEQIRERIQECLSEHKVES